MAEYYRQFAFVSSVLAGFAFTFYGALLVASPAHRAASWAALMAVTASTLCLVTTLGTTFAAVRAADLGNNALSLRTITAPQVLFSMCFLGGIVFLFLSFGVAGWIRSRKLGIATTIVAALGLIGAFTALFPYLHAR